MAELGAFPLIPVGRSDMEPMEGERLRLVSAGSGVSEGTGDALLCPGGAGAHPEGLKYPRNTGAEGAEGAEAMGEGPAVLSVNHCSPDQPHPQRKATATTRQAQLPHR